jgi:hypothetical protein
MGEHCPPSRKRAPTRGGGEKVELPSGADAVGAFQRTVEQFRAAVTHMPRRREYLREEQFTVREEWTTDFEVLRGKTPVMRRYTKEGTVPESGRRSQSTKLPELRFHALLMENGAERLELARD